MNSVRDTESKLNFFLFVSVLSNDFLRAADAAATDDSH